MNDKNLRIIISLVIVSIITSICCPCISAEKYIENGIMYEEKEDGTIVKYSGWISKGKDRMYYKKGKLKKNCWVSRKGERIAFLTKDGTAAVGKVTISGTEYEFDRNGIIVQDDSGITLSLIENSPDKFKIVISFDKNSSDKFCRFDEGGYKVERLSKGKWENVTFADNLPIEICGEEIGLDAGGEYAETVELTAKYNLSAGRYRLCKSILVGNIEDMRGITPEYYKSNTKTFYVYFDVK